MGVKKPENFSSMERELDNLLSDLCVKWGFCIDLEVAQETKKSSSIEAVEFARKVLEGEGMNPDTEIKWVRKIAQKFRCRFGTNEIVKETFIKFERINEEQW